MLVLLFFLATLCTIPSLYKSVEQQLSDADALCYLSNYPDLKEKFGNDIKKAKSHWKAGVGGEGELLNRHRHAKSH